MPREPNGDDDARANLERFFELVPDLACIASTDGYFRKLNRQWERTLGYSRDELLATPYTDLIHPDDRAATAREVEAQLGGKTTAFFENRYRTKDGGYRVLSWRATPAHGDLLFATARDVTERRRLEADRAAEAKLTGALLETAKAVLESTDFLATARVVFDACKASTGATSGYVALRSEDGTENRVLLVDAGNMTRAADTLLRMPVHGVHAEVYRGGTTVLKNDFMRSAHAHRLPPGHVPLHHVLAVPLRVDGTAAGIMALANKPGGFTARDAVVAETFGDLAAIALRTKRGLDALRDSENLYHSLFDHLLNGFAYCRMLFEDGRPTDFVYLAVNQAFETQTGLTGVVGKRASEAIPGITESDPRLFEIYGRVSLTGHPECFEMFVEALQAWFSVSVYSPAREHFVTVFDVVTERKRTEHALRETSARLDLALRSASAAYWEWSAASGQVEWSQQMFALLGVDPTRGIASVDAWRAALHSEDRPAAERQVAEALSGHSPLHSDYRVVLPDGHIRWVNVVGTGVYDDDGRPMRMVGLCMDISSRRRAEEERLQLEAQLLQSQKMDAVGQLAGGIAHDFNNILAAMLMELNMLRLEPGIGPDDLSRSVDELLASANRAAALTRQLLLFSRRQPMRTSRYDVNMIVRELTNLLERLIGESVTMALSLPDDPIWIDGDAGMLEQVVTNLCVNARDAMPNGGRLTVSTRQVMLDASALGAHAGVHPGRFACVEVTDTGTGIDEVHLDRIFEPFYTTKEAGKGTGLGLATVHGIVAKHGGFVDVKSLVGAGTTFSVYLPAAEARSARDGRRTPPGLRGGSERILVVEDEPAVRRMAVRCLGKLGYQVKGASSGQDALRVWEEGSGEFDLLFTDMVMPDGLSGLDLCEQLRGRKPGLRTVIASGYTAEYGDGERFAEHDVAFIAKPYDIAALAAAVRARLDGV